MNICIACRFQINVSHQLLTLECGHFIHTTCSVPLKRDYNICFLCCKNLTFNDRKKIRNLEITHEPELFQCFYCHFPIYESNQNFRLECGHVVHFMCAVMWKRDYEKCFKCFKYPTLNDVTNIEKYKELQMKIPK